MDWKTAKQIIHLLPNNVFKTRINAKIINIFTSTISMKFHKCNVKMYLMQYVNGDLNENKYLFLYPHFYFEIRLHNHQKE